MNSELFTLQALAGLAGASFLTYLFVQYTKKSLDKVLRIPTDIYAVIVAFLILDLAQIGLGMNFLDFRVHFLSLANAFLVAAAAAKMNDVAANPPGKSKDPPPPAKNPAGN
jgi:hypothetical protein